MNNLDFVIRSVGKLIAVDVRGLRFDSQARQIGHSVAHGLAIAAMFLRSCVVQALSRVDGSRHSLHASV